MVPHVLGRTIDQQITCQCFAGSQSPLRSDPSHPAAGHSHKDRSPSTGSSLEGPRCMFVARHQPEASKKQAKRGMPDLTSSFCCTRTDPRDPAVLKASFACKTRMCRRTGSMSARVKHKSADPFSSKGEAHGKGGYSTSPRWVGK